MLNLTSYTGVFWYFQFHNFIQLWIDLFNFSHRYDSCLAFPATVDMFDRYCIKWKTECWKIISHSVTLSLLRAGQSQMLSTFASLLTSWCCRITRPSGESLGAIWSSMRPRTSRTSSPSAGRVCWTSTGQWRLFVYMGPHQRVKPEAQWMRHGLWIFLH